MKWLKDIWSINDPRDLGDYIRLNLGFFGCLILLGVYQQIRLFGFGVVDSVFSKNLLLLWMNHLGFAALMGLILVAPFKLIEAKKSSWGFKFSAVVLLVILALELVFTEFFVAQFELPETGFWQVYFQYFSTTQFLLSMFFGVLLGAQLLRALFKWTLKIYPAIGRMFPFTLVLLSLFLATLMVSKKPVNENKNLHLLDSWVSEIFEQHTYEGTNPYPLVKTRRMNEDWTSLLQLGDSLPNIILITIDGLSHDFIGKDGPFRAFAPELNALTTESLHWKNHLSNVGEKNMAFGSIVGSLPFGEKGFTQLNPMPDRNTLFGILKKNGYYTSFQYGGNAAIPKYDKLVFEERVNEFIDEKSFGASYTKQDEDWAGNTLGYPDEALYSRFLNEKRSTSGPAFHVLLSLSSQYPYQIPDKSKYEAVVNQQLESGNFSRRERRLIRKNRDYLSAISYADQALGKFLKAFRKTETYANSILLITGSHRPAHLPFETAVERFKVPLILHSPGLITKGEREEWVSHMDIAPSVLKMLSDKFLLELPPETAFIGEGLLTTQSKQQPKKIPLMRNAGNFKDFIIGNFMVSGRSVRELDAAMNEKGSVEDALEDELLREYRFYKGVNQYISQTNRLIPEAIQIYTPLIQKPGKKDMVWVNSVFNGQDFDAAYSTARELALDGDRNRALLLCNYILSEVPGHADTEILMGRIHAWNGAYSKAIEILEQTILKYPLYADGYEALLDVYYWAGQHQNALELKSRISRNLPEHMPIREKIKRAEDLALRDAVGSKSVDSMNKIQLQP